MIEDLKTGKPNKCDHENETLSGNDYEWCVDCGALQLVHPNPKFSQWLYPRTKLNETVEE